MSGHELAKLIEDERNVIESQARRIAELEAIVDIGSDALREKVAELSAEVCEWLCEECDTVYPGPPQPGAQCVMCPHCGGTTTPRGTIERRKLENRIADLEQALAEANDRNAQAESFARGNVGIHWAEENDQLRRELAERGNPTCPECGSAKVTHGNMPRTFAYGDLGDVTYAAPFVECDACGVRWMGAAIEDAEAQAIIKFLHANLAERIEHDKGVLNQMHVELTAVINERTKERDALSAALGNAYNTLDAIEEGRGHCKQQFCADAAMNQRAVRNDLSAILATRLTAERKAGAIAILRKLRETMLHDGNPPHCEVGCDACYVGELIAQIERWEVTI